jgi:hypothetical protein
MTQKAVYFVAETRLIVFAGVIKATHPDFEYQPLFPPEELGDAGRVRWVSGTPGKPPSLRGNRFYRRPEWSHCFDLSLFRQSSLKQNAPPQ